MEERIGGRDVWDEHGRRVSFKCLDMLEDNSHAVKRHICVVQQQMEESMQGPIYFTILQVDGDRVDGIRDFLGARGSINACNC